MKANILQEEVKDTPQGAQKRVKVEAPVKMDFEVFLCRMKKEVKTFAEHDFVAR